MKKFLLCSLCSLLLIPVLFTGCVTSPDGTNSPDIERISNVAREAATFGTLEALRARPDWADEFAIAHKELKALSTAEKITVGDLLTVLNRLPIKELQSNEARITIGAARILIAGSGWSAVDAVRLAQIRPVVVAIVEGLEFGGVKP